MHQHKPVLGKDGNPVRPCEGLWDRATHEALNRVILHRMVPWTRNSHREYLLTKIALCGQCHTMLHGAPDQTDLAAAAAQPHAVSADLALMRVQQPAEPDLGCHVIVPLAGGYRLALRAWGFHPAPYLDVPDVPDEVSAQAVARFLSGREGYAHLRVPLGVAHPPRRPRARAGRSLADAPLRRIDAARQNLPPLTQ